MSQAFSGNVNSFNISNNFTAADQRPEILAWLSPLEPRIRHQDVRTRRVDDVGDWLLQTDQFRSWYDATGKDESDKAVLFCYGNPGVGKTHISSLVIDALCDRARGQNVAVACFYCDFTAQKEQSPTSMLGAMLKQVVGGLKEIPEEIVQAFEDQKQVIGGRGLRLPEIVKLLQIISSSRRTFICVDALDECVPEHRVKLLGSLREILQKSPGTRIFLTGRPHIQSEIENRLGRRTLSLSISPHEDDIIRYLHARLEEDTTPEAMDDSLEADILKSIPESVSETFLLVSLKIQEILQETTIFRRRKKLNAMTDALGLEDAYGATLERIKGQGGDKSRLGIAALMWISHSQRPLQVDELCHALAVEIGSTDFDTENIPSIMTVQSCCQGLVIVDKESSTIRLIHFTLQEYFSSHPELFDRAHSTIADTCLTYLNSQQVKALSLTTSHDLRSTPFLEYSSIYWGTHAKMELSDCTKSLALQLFSQYDKHISVRLLLEKVERTSKLQNEHSLFTGLHCASFFGIVDIVAALIEKRGGCNIGQGDSTGATPLMWASRNGHEGVVNLLLQQEDVTPDEPDEEGRTSLVGAARKGHGEVVKQLLGREDVNPDITGKYFGQTPLSWAAENSNEVVRLLLEREDVSPDKPDEGQTSLLWAAENGNEEVVKQLLEREDVKPDTPDIGGRTPPLWACRRGHAGVVKLLLSREDVNPNKSDEEGRTPLLWASQNGNEEVAKQLIERQDVSPEKPDENGQTPLLLAVRNGHVGIVKHLLERDDVSPDTPDEGSRTPLSWAAQNGNVEVAKKLLERGGGSHIPDEDGQTPLLWAARRGHAGVVKLLLEQQDISPDRPDNGGRTPLLWAARKGREGVVKLLLSREDVNPNYPDRRNQTALLWAAREGHVEVVQLLLERESIDPDKPDRKGRTAAAWARIEKQQEVLDLLRAWKPTTPSTV